MKNFLTKHYFCSQCKSSVGLEILGMSQIHIWLLRTRILYLDISHMWYLIAYGKCHANAGQVLVLLSERKIEQGFKATHFLPESLLQKPSAYP